MKKLSIWIQEKEKRLFSLLDVHSFNLLRISIGLIYLIFGLLKFFPEYSPAEKLASDTICVITFDLLSGASACTVLAAIETFIGIALIFNLWTSRIILLTLWHMLCTFLPLFLLPGYAFTTEPFSFSIVGQYILKNLVIISALFVLYRQVRVDYSQTEQENNG